MNEDINWFFSLPFCVSLLGLYVGSIVLCKWIFSETWVIIDDDEVHVLTRGTPFLFIIVLCEMAFSHILIW